VSTETRFSVIADDTDSDDIYGVLSVKITDEGVICDVENADGEVIATWGATAQELADEFCH
jgi:hypothetical protein